MDEKIISSLKLRYPVHPLIFHRSLERARGPGDLFDILDSFWELVKNNNAYPVIWHEDQHCWTKTDDMFQSANFVKKQK